MAGAEKKLQPIIIKKIKKGGHGHHGGAVQCDKDRDQPNGQLSIKEKGLALPAVMGGHGGKITADGGLDKR